MGSNNGFFWATSILLTAVLLFSASAHSHTRSISTSQWAIENDQISVVFSVKAYEVDKLTSIETKNGGQWELNELLLQHIQPRLKLASDDQACAPIDDPRSLAARKGYLRVEWQFLCPEGEELTLINNTFFDVASSHTHFAQVSQLGVSVREYIFNDRQRSFVISDAAGSATTWETFKRYTVLGVEHILGGVDHLAFVLALLLVCRRLRDVAWLVSGFTVGHGITITLSSLNWVATHLQIIEALIGFSIALVAVEAGFTRSLHAGETRKLSLYVGLILLALTVLAWLMNAVMPVTVMVGLILFSVGYLSLLKTPQVMGYLRPLVTAMFGLVHGFGFGSVLSDIGLPENQLLTGLLGFNIGVELGQLLVVLLLIWAVWFYRSIKPEKKVFDTPSNSMLSSSLVIPKAGAEALCAALCCVGMYWFISRGWVVAI